MDVKSTDRILRAVNCPRATEYILKLDGWVANHMFTSAGRMCATGTVISAATLQSGYPPLAGTIGVGTPFVANTSGTSRYHVAPSLRSALAFEVQSLPHEVNLNLLRHTHYACLVQP